jgi:hypothetical protein
MSASEGKADVFRFNFGSLRLNVRFSPKRTFRLAKTSCFEGPLSATSGHLSLHKRGKQTQFDVGLKIFLKQSQNSLDLYLSLPNFR